jgi:allantoin racemase
MPRPMVVSNICWKRGKVGRELKERDGADAIFMGCAGMARHRRPLEQALDIPVIDPTQAAVTMALGAVRLARL